MPTPAEVCLSVRNLPLAQAETLIRESGCTARIASQDGRHLMLTQDLRRDRINLTLMAGVVIDARPG